VNDSSRLMLMEMPLSCILKKFRRLCIWERLHKCVRRTLSVYLDGDTIEYQISYRGFSDFQRTYVLVCDCGQRA